MTLIQKDGYNQPVGGTSCVHWNGKICRCLINTQMQLSLHIFQLKLNKFFTVSATQAQVYNNYGAFCTQPSSCLLIQCKKITFIIILDKHNSYL